VRMQRIAAATGIYLYVFLDTSVAGAWRSVEAMNGVVRGLHRYASDAMVVATLAHLLREYLAGHAAVAPKNYPETCRHCDFPTLCRVRELMDRGPVGADENNE